MMHDWQRGRWQRRCAGLSIVALAINAGVAVGMAQVKRPRITVAIDEGRRITLSGNTKPEVRTGTDLGQVEDDLALDHMLLQLSRGPEQEQTLEARIRGMHDPSSSDFHHWITAAEFGAAYGPAQEDVEKITAWLQSRGFTVNSVSQGGTLIDFSGTAASVRQALHTQLHYFDVNGARHVANQSDPQIPAALAPAIAGIVSLNDFSPRSMRRSRTSYTFMSGNASIQAITPGDLATIYNLNPLFANGTTGKGQTIVVIEDTDLFSAQDWTTFRATFGLNVYTSGSLTTVHPTPSSGVNNCRAPGVNGDDGEAILDAEWASAAAPDAAIVLAACANTRSTFGGLIALQNLVNSAHPPSIVSISYGECEAGLGVAGNAAYNSIYQQAAAEGISVFVSSGDEGAASCDAGAKAASHGIGISGFASTPYNVAVGGTDFGDTVANTNSAYWNTTNSPTFASAKSYIPEIPWNDSCASQLLATFLGFTKTYGSSGFCGSSTARQNGLLDITAGSGGPSGCATGTPASPGVVGGTCRGYGKPMWQSGGPGIPSDGTRDIPDVSLFAANGIWGHYYVFCWSDIRNGGASCSGAPSTWAGGGGTSFSSPIVAGIQALVNQANGGAQGNPNPVYYKLAAISSYFCNSSTPGSACVFYNTTQGDMDVNCRGSISCFGATPIGQGGSITKRDGALSTSTSTLNPAFAAGSGWNFATGLGTLNAYNLVTNWKQGQ
jgi:subtilase family serine protease